MTNPPIYWDDVSLRDDIVSDFLLDLRDEIRSFRKRNEYKAPKEIARVYSYYGKPLALAIYYDYINELLIDSLLKSDLISKY